MSDSPRCKVAAIQIRVSGEDQTRGHSLETQLEESLDYKRTHGWQEGPIYKEVESAWKPKSIRQQYQQLIEDAEAGRFDVLIVWKLDRLTRKCAEGLRVLEHLVDDLRMLSGGFIAADDDLGGLIATEHVGTPLQFEKGTSIGSFQYD